MKGGLVLSFLTMILSSFVAVEITSHQNFHLSCGLKPAVINIALDLPIKVGIFLSTTEFCWGVPGAVNSNMIPRFCFEHSFWRTLFSPLLSNLTYLMSIPYLDFDSFIQVGRSSIWSLFSLQEEAVATITEFVNHNQPMSFSSHAFMFE